MNHQLDEPAKELAQSVTRRQARKKFSIGLSSFALASFGLAGRARAGTACIPSGSFIQCTSDQECCSGVCVRSKFHPNGGGATHHGSCA